MTEVENKKMGRPIKGKTARNHQMTFRMDEEEKKMLNSLVKKEGISRTELINKLIKKAYKD